MTFCTVSAPCKASSTFAFIGAALPRRYWPSEVITIFAAASSTRARSAVGEKPPNTTLCRAPIRAHASIAKIASGTICSWIATTSPATTPSDDSAFAAFETSSFSCE